MVIVAGSCANANSARFSALSPIRLGESEKETNVNKTPRSTGIKITTGFLVLTALWIFWKAFGWQTDGSALQESYKPVLEILLSPLAIGFLIAAAFVWRSGGKAKTP